MVYAAPPMAFDGWKNGTGGITATCQTGYNCRLNAIDKDMMQRIIVAPNGKKYVQTVVDSTAATADKTRLQLESFVFSGNSTGDGIAAKQTVTTPGVDSLATTVTLNTGWADSADSPSVKIEQLQKSGSKNPVGYASRFLYEGNLDSKGNTTGYYLAIRQEVTNSTKIGGTTSTTGKDIHVFETRKAGGDRVVAGSASLPAAAGGMGGMGGGGGPTGGSVSWKNGNEVQVIWIGQICEGCANQGGMMGGGMGGTTGTNPFSFQAYDNLSDSAAAIASRNFSTSPINWQTQPFGAAPTFTPGL